MTPATAVAPDLAEIRPHRIRPVLASARASVAAAPVPSVDTGAIVARPRLLAQLAQAGRVVVVSAPAGSGKTSLLRSWIHEAGLEPTAAWVPVEQSVRDPQRFWISVLEAIRQTAPGIALLREVTAAPGMDGWAIVNGLLADLARLEHRLWLIIDDLDELESSETLRQFEQLLACAPVQLRFAISTRRDLPLGLHRIRLDGDLTELRGADLQFTCEEARALFQTAGVDLPECALKVLVERTEGWAAGLRLAALSLARHPEPERFVAEFSGSERTVAEYLLAEVLEREPAEVRELLLRTSVLEQVSGPLADHLGGGSGSERVLQELEDANAFVTSVDAGRSWFRYHRLFADFLQLELRRSFPATVASLHRAASEWFDHEGYVVESIRHAQAARDWRPAASLLLDNHIRLMLDGRLGSVRELLDAFPSRVAAEDPELAVVAAGIRLREGAFDAADKHIAVAERNAEEVAEDRKPLFELHLAGVRLSLARQRRDLGGALEAMCSLDAALGAHLPGPVSRTEEIRALALMSLGTTELWSLRLSDACRHLEEGLALARRIGRPYLEVGCLAQLGTVAPLRGLSPSLALDYSENAVAVAEAHGLGTNVVLAPALAVGAGAMAWLGRFDKAECWLERAEILLDPGRDPAAELVLHHARGLLRSAQGRLELALAAFRDGAKAQSMLAGGYPLSDDLRARIMLTQVRMGAVADARAALDSLPEHERDRAEVRVAAAAIHLAEGNADLAAELLTPVTARSVQSAIPTWAAITGLLFEAAARDELGDTWGAEQSVERALDLAEPEGLILPFTIAPVEGLLERHPRHRTAHATFLSTVHDVRAGQSATPRSEPAAVVDELSAAELRVIRYLPSNLRAPEIAAELFVSTNTIRTHLRHIYGKLGVHGRAEAVARAREVGLLAPARRHR